MALLLWTNTRQKAADGPKHSLYQLANQAEQLFDQEVRLSKQLL